MRTTTRRAIGAVAALALTTAGAGAQQLLSKNISVGGIARSYLVYLPVNFDPSEAMPAMFFFHGGGGTANGGLFECDFRPLADAERFIVILLFSSYLTYVTNYKLSTFSVSSKKVESMKSITRDSNEEMKTRRQDE